MLIHSAQILTSEPHVTSADVSTGHVPAGASVCTWVGFALVVIDVAVSAAPTGVTQTLITDRDKMLKSQVFII